MRNDEFVLVILHNNALIKKKEDADYDYLFNALDVAMDKVQPRHNMDDIVSKLELESSAEAEKELTKNVPVLAYSQRPYDNGSHLHQVRVSVDAYREKPGEIKNLLRHEFTNPSMIIVYI